MIRSQSVNEQRIPDKDSGQEIERKSDKDDQSSLDGKVKVNSKERRHSNHENGVATSVELENLRQSRQSAANTKPPIPKSVHKNSNFDSNTSDSSHLQNTSQGHHLPDRNSFESVLQKFSNSTNNFSVHDSKAHSEVDKKTDQTFKDQVKKRDHGGTNTFSSRRHSSYDVRNSNINGYISEETGIHKPVELLKDTVKRLENKIQGRDSENDVKVLEKNDHERKSRSEVKSHDKGSGLTHGRSSHILVSKAGVERDKQSRLVNLRRNRSHSEPRREPGYHSKTVVDEKEVGSKKLDSSKEVEKQKIASKSEITLDGGSKNLAKEIKDSSVEPKVQENSREDKRLSPPLLWLEEKRKSLNTTSESDKLLSTLDIEAAFSEILGAVDDIPEKKAMMETATTEVPILEEDSCETSEMEENAVENDNSKENGNARAATSKNIVGDTNGAVEITTDTQSVNNQNDNVDGDGHAVSPSNGSKKSEGM